MTFDLRNITFVRTLSGAVDSAAAWFFCCTIGVFILPLLMERIVFYLPLLYRLTKTKEVYARSLWFTMGEIILWTLVISGVYTGLYFLDKSVFRWVTVSPPALLAWVTTVGYILLRTIRFDKTVKRSFYYNAYMRFITPDALGAYQSFIEDVDNMDLDALQTQLSKELPYMHRQAVLRKHRQMSAGQVEMARDPDAIF